MIRQLIAFLPNLLGIIGAQALGGKRRFGFVFLFASETAWAWLAVVTQLWTLLAWAVIWAAMWAHNYRKWAA